MSNVAHVNDGPIHCFYRQPVQLIDSQWTVVQLDVVLEATNLLRTSRNDLVLRSERIGDVLSRKFLGLKSLRIKVDLYLSNLAAIRRRNGHPWDA